MRMRVRVTADENQEESDFFCSAVEQGGRQQALDRHEIERTPFAGQGGLQAHGKLESSKLCLRPTPIKDLRSERWSFLATKADTDSVRGQPNPLVGGDSRHALRVHPGPSALPLPLASLIMTHVDSDVNFHNL